MSPRPTDDADCPVCGRPYERRVVVARGDSWDDLYPGSPFAFFRKFRRRCTARVDAETDRTLPDDERAVYLHGAGTRPGV